MSRGVKAVSVRCKPFDCRQMPYPEQAKLNDGGKPNDARSSDPSRQARRACRREGRRQHAHRRDMHGHVGGALPEFLRKQHRHARHGDGGGTEHGREDVPVAACQRFHGEGGHIMP